MKGLWLISLVQFFQLTLCFHRNNENIMVEAIYENEMILSLNNEKNFEKRIYPAYPQLSGDIIKHNKYIEEFGVLFDGTQISTSPIEYPWKFGSYPSPCLTQVNDHRTHSPQIGWAADGFPIYGPYGIDGEMKPCNPEFPVTSTTCLDACGGVEENNPLIDQFSYRYYLTRDLLLCASKIHDSLNFNFSGCSTLPSYCHRGCCSVDVACSAPIRLCSSISDSLPRNHKMAERSCVNEKQTRSLLDETLSPTFEPTASPSYQPTLPTFTPSLSPSLFPTSTPTHLSTISQTLAPTPFPNTSIPTHFPTTIPSSNFPSSIPSSSEPTSLPSSIPSSSEPTSLPSSIPSSSEPTSLPSSIPSSSEPTSLPSSIPSSSEPTSLPSSIPSSSVPTSLPSSVPTSPSSIPTFQPSSTPTSQPSNQPSSFPTSNPTNVPSSSLPTISFSPTSTPTISQLPTTTPTSIPSSSYPTSQPSSSEPSSLPSSFPTSDPTSSPSILPTSIPSSTPSSLPSHIPTIIYQLNCGGKDCHSETQTFLMYYLPLIFAFLFVIALILKFSTISKGFKGIQKIQNTIKFPRRGGSAYLDMDDEEDQHHSEGLPNLDLLSGSRGNEKKKSLTEDPFNFGLRGESKSYTPLFSPEKKRSNASIPDSRSGPQSAPDSKPNESSEFEFADFAEFVTVGFDT